MDHGRNISKPIPAKPWGSHAQIILLECIYSIKELNSFLLSKLYRYSNEFLYTSFPFPDKNVLLFLPLIRLTLKAILQTCHSPSSLCCGIHLVTNISYSPVKFILFFSPEMKPLCWIRQWTIFKEILMCTLALVHINSLLKICNMCAADFHLR